MGLDNVWTQLFHLSLPLTLQLDTSHFSTKTSSALLTPSVEAMTSLSPRFQLETSPSTWQRHFIVCRHFFNQVFPNERRYNTKAGKILEFIQINRTSILLGPLPFLTVSASRVQDLCWWISKKNFISTIFVRHHPRHPYCSICFTTCVGVHGSPACLPPPRQ